MLKVIAIFTIFANKTQIYPFTEVIYMSKISILREFWMFLKERKKWWLGPIIFFLVLLGILIVFAEGSALAPFIYTLF